MKKFALVLLLLAALYVGFLFWVAREVPLPAVAIPPDATAVLEQDRFAPPPGWRLADIETSVGRVRWGHAPVASARAAVFFLPGLSAPMEIYHEAYTRLVEAGYAVVALDWPGQGASARGSAHPEKIHARSLDGHLAAADAVLAELQRRYPEQPVLLVGLSMGAQLGARLIAERPDTFTAAALVTPALGIYGDRPTPAQRVLLQSLEWIGLGDRYAPGTGDWRFDLDAHNGVASACSHPNDRTRLWYANMARDESLRVGGMTNSFVLALADSARAARAPETIARIDIPVWMPLAGDDVFVANEVAAKACESLADCRLTTYAEARHCLFEEADRFYQPFVSELTAFLDAQVPDSGAADQ